MQGTRAVYGQHLGKLRSGMDLNWWLMLTAVMQRHTTRWELRTVQQTKEITELGLPLSLLFVVHCMHSGTITTTNA